MILSSTVLLLVVTMPDWDIEDVESSPDVRTFEDRGGVAETTAVIEWAPTL